MNLIPLFYCAVPIVDRCHRNKDLCQCLSAEQAIHRFTFDFAKLDQEFHMGSIEMVLL